MQPFAGTQADEYIRVQKTRNARSSITRNKQRLDIQKKRWIIHPLMDYRMQLAKSLKISPLLAQILINRSVTVPQTGYTFLRPKLTQLIRPEQMPGIEPALHRLKQALEYKEKITIYGDYDVDGITGVSILWQILTLLGANVDYYIPHRIDEGYGLNTEAIRYLAKSGTGVLITVDCGICALDSAELAEQLAVDLIITDHHQPQAKLPKAAAIVHPALDESYQNQDSAGATVALKLAWALAEEFSRGPRLEPKLREFMLNATSLAAIGTIADIVDLRGENRVLTSYGLKAIPECKLCGIQALIESADLTGQGLDSFHIGFRLAPMLNAAGRMGHARLAVELLTSNSQARSMQIAEYLKQQNIQRQQVERKIFKHACEMIFQLGLNHPDRRSIVLANKDWHSGVLGIVASRTVDKFYRPTIMINTAGENGTAQGSGRSIPGFCLLSAIKACSQHLQNFGGHKMAAGITIKPEKIESFAADLEAYASENLSADDIVATLDIDAMACLAEINWDTINQLKLLGPFGQGNPRPIFATKGVRLASTPRRVGANSEHLQLAITDNTNSIRCIGFGMGKLEKKLLEQEFFNVAYEAQINTYNGASNVELVLTDIQFE
jgi:single-stranded-DNA-specific exonuclease